MRVRRVVYQFAFKLNLVFEAFCMLGYFLFVRCLTYIDFDMNRYRVLSSFRDYQLVGMLKLVTCYFTFIIILLPTQTTYIITIRIRSRSLIETANLL